MRAILIFFSLMAIFILPSRSQHRILPEDIATFYRDKNFVNTVCLSIEKDKIILMASRNIDLSSFKDGRLHQATEIMQGVVSKILPVMDNMNPMESTPMPPYHLFLTEFNYITGWRQSGNRIYVSLDTYSADNEINAKYVASYTPDQTPENYKRIDLSELKFYSKEVHEWVLENSHWYKPSVNVILVD